MSRYASAPRLASHVVPGRYDTGSVAATLATVEPPELVEDGAAVEVTAYTYDDEAGTVEARADDGDDPRARERCHLLDVRDAARVAVTRDRDTCPVHPGTERVETRHAFGAVCPRCRAERSRSGSATTGE